MKLGFGKHAGKSVEILIIKEPQYITWMLKQAATGPMVLAQEHAQKKIAQFDAKLIVEQCNDKACARLATQCVVYANNVTSPYWVCDSCNPYDLGAPSGKLQALQSFEESCRYVANFCGNRLSDHRTLILELARAKGLPKRVAGKAAINFFD